METVEQPDRWAVVAAARGASGVPPSDLDAEAREQRARAARVGARLLLERDAAYPPALRAIASPPPFLLVRGEVREEDALAVAVVGSRRATPYGLTVAERLSAELAARGVTVVSGFARGIDTAAHRGALAAGGRTLAILGSGADVIYPPENRALVSRVVAQGALVSQFPMGTPALAAHFPLRNRTIAALTLGTLVVEAAERSGALITAASAGELGREVFAVPGPVTSETSRGTHRLIQDGAKLVQDVADIVAELAPAWRGCLKEPPRAGEAEPVDADEARLLELVGSDPVHIDRLIEASGVASGRAAGLLLGLELKGWVRQVAGQRYLKIRAGGA